MVGALPKYPLSDLIAGSVKRNNCVCVAQQGSIFVLLGVIIVALLSLISLVVDGGILASSQSRYEHTADYAVQAALRAYTTSNASTNSARLAEAAARASAITGVNVSTFGEQGLLEDPTQVQDDLQVSVQDNSSGENGKLIPGRYHFVETESTPVSCKENGIFRPCFEELASTSENASAFRLEINLHPQGQIKTFFARIFGHKSMALNATATASLVPRRGVFLLDLSRNITRLKHTNFSFESTLPAEYAFQFSAGQTCAAGKAGLDPDEDRSRFDDLPNSRSSSSSQWVHFEEDYNCIRLGDFASTSELSVTNAHFLVDTVTDPEPLTSVLSNLNKAMEYFANRNVPGDKVAIIGFDDELLEVRVMNLRNPDLSDPEYQEFVQATDTSDKTNKFQKFLFPRYRPNNSMDLKMAIEAAYKMLNNEAPYQTVGNEPEFDLAENFVALITGGLSTCAENRPEPEVPCDDSQAYIEQSLREVREYLNENYLPQNIIFHTILSNPAVGPHTLLRTLGNGMGCMNDGHNRDSNPVMSYVNGDDYDATGTTWTVNPETFSTPAQPVYYPNLLYSDVQALNGIWGPVRPCCRLDGDPAPGQPLSECTNVENILTNSCRASATKGEVISIVPGIATYIGETDNWLKYASVDDNGRLLCDPEPQSESEQIEDYFDKILYHAPQVIVE